jgi:hypothetical protein
MIASLVWAPVDISLSESEAEIKAAQEVKLPISLQERLDRAITDEIHLDHLKRKLTPYIFATRRLRPCLTRDALWRIYFAFFLSRTIYLNPI